MFQEFFAGKVQRDLALTGQWIRFLEEKENELTPEVRQIISKILNSHHIWNCRLKQLMPESDLNDALPLSHWQQLLQANFRETIAYLDDFSAEEKIRFHDSEGVQPEQLTVDILFQLLQDNQFYRGQLTLLCEQLGWQVFADEGLIVLKKK
jgi:uncharacterized damage-inducible protein DinB